MKMELSRRQGYEADGAVAAKLSEQAAYHLSQILETFGIREIRVGFTKSMSGETPRLSEVSYFDGVPPEISSWAVPAEPLLACLMAVFGMSGLSLKAEGPDDESELSRLWAGILSAETPKWKPPVREWGVSGGERIDVGGDMPRLDQATPKPIQPSQPAQQESESDSQDMAGDGRDSGPEVILL